jgi:MFS family permease
MPLRFIGLWRQADFVKLWTGQTISMIGSAITTMALPLTAVLVLKATPTQMGLLVALESLPVLFIGLFAGVWIDRHQRRPILIAADLGRAAVLILVPITAILHILRIEYLYGTAFLVGLMGLFFDVAHRSYLPTLVEHKRLLEGNSKLEMSHSIAEIAGPGLAGWLVQILSAPIAIVFDAISFLISALFLGLIHKPEPEPEPLDESNNVFGNMRDGLRLVSGDQYLRAIAGGIGLLNLFNSVLEAVFILYLTRNLKVTPALLGLIFASGSVGFLLGTLLPDRIAKRWGIGSGIISGVFLIGFSDFLLPSLTNSASLTTITIIMIIAQFFFGLGLVVFNIGQVSLRQSITPDKLQGRMNATMSLVAWGIVPLGGLLGGLLGDKIGLRSTLFLAAFGEIIAAFWLLLSPIRKLNRQLGLD